jgi:membrane protease YdiL (CAAX protease family)
MGERDMGADDESNATSPEHPTFAAATAPSYARTLFWSSDGLRPGWGLCFYFVAFMVLDRLTGQLAWAHDLGDSGLWSRMLEELGDFLAALIPAVALARIERRPWRTYGLPIEKAFGRFFWIGCVWGFLAISLLIFAIYEGHAFLPGHLILHGWRLLRFAAYWGAFFIFVAFFEDFLMRGYSLFTLARGIGFWPAAFVLSCLFGLFHLGNEGEHWSGAVMAGVIGLFFCLTLRRTGSLWFAIGFHAAWDWGETFFYSVPDSGIISPGHLLNSSLRGPRWLTGGSVGPEGSAVCLLVIAVAWAAFAKVYPQPTSTSHNSRINESRPG